MDILVRDLAETTIARLKARAARNGRSLQSEVRLVLDAAAKADTDAQAKAARREEFRAWAAALRARNAHIPQTDSAELIRGDRDR